MIGWGTPEQVAAVCGVSRHTVRTWAKRGLIASACCVVTGRLIVWWVEVDKLAEPIRDDPERGEKLRRRRVA